MAAVENSTTLTQRSSLNIQASGTSIPPFVHLEHRQAKHLFMLKKMTKYASLHRHSKDMA